jgi:U3 small nucleolar RNA-associated protein MPP10
VCGVLEDALGETKQDDDADLDSDAEMRKMLEALEVLERKGMNLEDFISAEDDEALIGHEGWLDQDSDDEDDEGLDDDEDDEEEIDDDETEEDVVLDEGVTGLQDAASSSQEEEGDEYLADSDVELGTSTSNRTISSVLDDDFFNLLTFNAESEAAEATHVSTGSLGRNSDSEYSEDDDDDASFDIFAPVHNSEQFDEDELDRNDVGTVKAVLCHYP